MSPRSTRRWLPLPALSLRTWLLLSHGVVLALPLIVLVGTGALASDLRAQTHADLRNQAALLTLWLQSEVAHARDGDPAADLDDLTHALSPRLVAARRATLAGVRLVDHRGVVVASSGDELGEDLSHRPEVAAALEGAQALSVRPRPAPRTRSLSGPSRKAQVRLFLGEPLVVDGRTVGAVVLSRTPREELQALYQMLPWWVVVLPMGLTALIGLGAGHLFSRSLHQLAGAADSLTAGRAGAADDLERPAHSRVAEVRSLAQAFRTTTRRLADRLAWISEFAANVSHEFKTPLSTLRGTLELLTDDPDMPPAQRARFLTNAEAELDRLTRLVSGLLALARAEQHADPRPVDLDALLAEAARRHGVRRPPTDGPLGVVQGDEAQLSTVLDNLLGNARRAAGPDGTVTLVPLRRAGRVGFDVVDDGPGISPANLPRVFDRFFTTHRGQGGTGLGLALVRAVVKAHGGGVDVRSEPGETVFRVRLPPAADHPQEPA